ncbi:MAG TPA: signal peptide peptidase SppA, partial [Patescibacteria group bacterium]
MIFKETVFSIGKWLTTAWLFIANSIGSLVLIGIILVFAFGLFSSSTTTPNISQKVIEEGGLDKVAIVNLSGPIVESAGSSDPLALSPEIVASRRVLPLLDHLAEDDSVKVVMLRINSPGGAVVPSDEIYRKVLELREKKPVVASMGDTAASGGYYIAAGANKIIANPATITGSIGVIAQFPEVSGLFNKLGVEMRTFKTGEFKDIGSVTREVTAAEDEIITNMINEMYSLFVQAIVDGRQMDEAKVRELADGRIYTGLQAKENGLIDELGNYDYSIEYASSLAGIDNPTVVEYSD